MKSLWKKVKTMPFILMVIMVLVTGCGGGEADKGGSKDSASAEKIIRVSEANVPKIDPGVGSDYSSSVALCNLYDTLVYPNDDGTLKPMLATKWETTDNGLTWIFDLRQGVKFHNGEELTAEDVVFSMERMLKMGEGYGYLYTNVIAEAKALDTYKVQFKLKETFGPFLSTLVRLYVLDKSQVMANIKTPGPYGEMGDYGKDWLLNHDAGSGPFKVQELKMQEYLSAERFEQYWGGWDKDAPEAFKIIGTNSAPTIRTLMTRKELEISDQWQSEEALKALDEIPGVSVNSAFMGSMMNIMLNTKKAPTDDVHFRKALAYILDYQIIENKIFPGSKKALGPVPFNLPGAAQGLPQYSRNLEKAKQELEKSKYANNLEKYPVELAWIAEVPDEEKIALLLQANAAELGIKINIVKTPWLSFTEQVASPETTANASIIFVSPHYNDAGSVIETRYHSNSAGTWEQCEWLKDTNLDIAIKQAIGTVEDSLRASKYKAIQESIVDLCPTLWVFDQAEKRAYQSDYILWPAAEAGKAGKPVNTVMGYAFYFHDFKVYPEKVTK
ncbi:extracellular solute-binding protein, family 5 [Desulforamulus reducens MI-1]|uniref:Extracellular solute-binding protein, family 5 n=1 Tax=Desulforamulus reducens (strain ATCC BAA-1160 / DSM 100696 / MI-1) TaxID=349161 RepID=A4J4T7_DESRM|nr:ABC transporter substrate-binding protein [Desulforamulus reducens]ABO50090.1 extracellular solute-binding protein, family 5 [Desulforamulus reducens MI-1]